MLSTIFKLTTAKRQGGRSC